MKRLAVRCVCFAIITASLLFPGQTRAQRVVESGRSELSASPRELLVQFREGVTPEDKGRALGRANAESFEDILPGRGRRDRHGDLILVRHPAAFASDAARRALESDPAVEFVEPNWIVTNTASSNDPYYTNGSQWNM